MDSLRKTYIAAAIILSCTLAAGTAAVHKETSALTEESVAIAGTEAIEQPLEQPSLMEETQETSASNEEADMVEEAPSIQETDSQESEGAIEETKETEDVDETSAEPVDQESVPETGVAPSSESPQEESVDSEIPSTSVSLPAEQQAESAADGNVEGAVNPFLEQEEIGENPVPDGDMEKQLEEASGEDSSKANKELISNQVITHPQNSEINYRFWTVEKETAFTKIDGFVYSDKNENSVQVGSFKKTTALYILKQEGDWDYVESGDVRGFVRASDLASSEEAEKITKIYQAVFNTVKKNGEVFDLEQYAVLAEPLVAREDNPAFFYYMATVYSRVIRKTYVMPIDGAVNVREEENEASRIIGKLPENCEAYLIQENDGWAYIESGNVRGFVRKDLVSFEEDTQKKADAIGADHLIKASEYISPKDNRAFYYTLTSTMEGNSASAVRDELIQFASQFIGCPYVWGGTSLTNGADCSGFVREVYREFGYELPRTSASQSNYGTKIPVEYALPGDLIFYAKNGKVFHVVIYAGNGQTVEAQTESTGIIRGHVAYGASVWATRILP